ncbi:NAD(P)H-hydrate epimerase [Bordetella holmesii]|uniref:NAD(P)H-hydrate epimerase n=2 Tax=Bordetella holmesii TaxID=35814 RepID=A0A158LZA5_9BORD|nr:NAD(P)H-hydrate epimerase [Bordetella holmesii H558]AOB34933.1 NAD(P)H-hydrate epimerase [Bordetella holmesii]KAK82440.1 YjeF family N-terminal domain protein [Bordetella holmesii CDC-H572-BH]KAK86735.1 YjeF family N-terminal domain protein [Bordetella holmesii CDC-H585-BH]KCV03765.1 YjeF family N-terminal domain protein [Bordetella holmesii CDC-H629-BH]KCV07443.1 YjeF family N-terminal domain protein [Bordetella holmesii CDC-H785-BH]KCV16599.1 YjeF family N-terminal domain protein [Bordet
MIERALLISLVGGVAMRVYTLEQLRRIEAGARDLGMDLMGRAGRAAADFVRVRLSAPGPVLAVVGPGNNGGDALVAATALLGAGYAVQVVMPGDPARLPRDAARAHAAWRAAGGREDQALPRAAPALAIDGLFGIGLTRRLGQPWQDLVDAVNRWRIPVLALDVPSGLSAQTGQALGRPVQARWTLSFIGTPSALAQGAAAMGQHYEEDLGLPPQWLSALLTD